MKIGEIKWNSQQNLAYQEAHDQINLVNNIINSLVCFFF